MIRGHAAIAKMRSVLGEVIIEGVKTNLDFEYDILKQKDFEEGRVTTHFIEEHYFFRLIQKFCQRE